MNRHVASFLFVLLIIVVSVGFFRGWFTLTKSSPEDGSSQVNVNLMVDPDKMEQDADTMKKKAGDLVGQVKDSTTKTSEKPKEPVNAPEQNER